MPIPSLQQLEHLALPMRYGGGSPFPTMSLATDVAKEKDFFETRVSEYQIHATPEWD